MRAYSKIEWTFKGESQRLKAAVWIFLSVSPVSIIQTGHDHRRYGAVLVPQVAPSSGLITQVAPSSGLMIDVFMQT